MRPKSIATVVSDLRERVSSVMPFSVDSTVISLIVRISVVLPAAKGPVTTIFTAVPALRRRGRVDMSEPPYAGDESQQHALVDARVPLDRGSRCGGRHPAGDGGEGDWLRVVRRPLRQHGLGASRGDVAVVSCGAGARHGHQRAGRRRLDGQVLDDRLLPPGAGGGWTNPLGRLGSP